MVHTRGAPSAEREGGTHEFLVVHGANGGVGLSLLAVGDESETTGPAGSRLAAAVSAVAGRGGSRHDDAVEHLSELGEGVAERVVVCSPAPSAPRAPVTAPADVPREVSTVDLGSHSGRKDE